MEAPLRHSPVSISAREPVEPALDTFPAVKVTSTTGADAHCAVATTIAEEATELHLLPIAAPVPAFDGGSDGSGIIAADRDCAEDEVGIAEQPLLPRAEAVPIAIAVEVEVETEVDSKKKKIGVEEKKARGLPPSMVVDSPKFRSMPCISVSPGMHQFGDLPGMRPAVARPSHFGAKSASLGSMEVTSLPEEQCCVKSAALGEPYYGWTFRDSIRDVPTLPEFHPLERTAVFVPRSRAPEVGRRVADVLRERSISAIYDNKKAKANCVAEDGVEFRVRLYRGRGKKFSHGIICEVQRRFGFSPLFVWHVHAILDAAEGKTPAPAPAPVSLIPPSGGLIPAVSDVDDDDDDDDFDIAGTGPSCAGEMREAPGSTSLLIACHMLMHDCTDIIALALEILVSLTDSKRMGAPAALYVSKRILSGYEEGEVVRNAVVGLLVDEALDIFESTADIWEKDDDGRAELRLHAMTILNNAVSFVGSSHSQDLLEEQADFLAKDVVPTIVAELRESYGNARMAVAAAKCLKALLTSEAIGRDMIAAALECDAENALKAALDVGRRGNCRLEEESSQCLETLCTPMGGIPGTQPAGAKLSETIGNRRKGAKEDSSVGSEDEAFWQWQSSDDESDDGDDDEGGEHEDLMRKLDLGAPGPRAGSASAGLESSGGRADAVANDLLRLENQLAPRPTDRITRPGQRPRRPPERPSVLTTAPEQSGRQQEEEEAARRRIFAPSPPQPSTTSAGGEKERVAVYCVTVPPGVRPGNNFPVRAGGKIVTVRCPPGVRPGSTVQITVVEEQQPPSERQSSPRSLNPASSHSDLGSSTDAQSGPAAAGDGSSSTEKMHIFRVVAPPGATPGRPFETLVEGKRILVPCPENVSPGGVILFRLPAGLLSK